MTVEINFIAGFLNACRFIPSVTLARIDPSKTEWRLVETYGSRIKTVNYLRSRVSIAALC